MKPKVEPNHYFNKSYDTKERFISYWHQINEILSLEPKSLLEVGIGNGLVANYLKQHGINIITLDIDERLNPDYIGSVLDLPFPNDLFEVVACYEVLEHLPYKDFSKALKEIYRVTSKYAVLSLPDATRVCKLYLHIPKIGVYKKLIPIPFLKPPEHESEIEHYWEIGRAGHPLNRTAKDIQKSGFKIKETYRPFEHPYHRFFILNKIKARKIC